MENNDDRKLSKFLIAINSYAEQQKEQIHKEVEEFKLSELQKAEAEVLQDSYILIHNEMNQMRSVISRDLSRREMDSRKQLLNKRREITDTVFDRVKKALIEYTKTPEYTLFMETSARNLAQYLTADDTVLYMNKKDKPLTSQIVSAFAGKCSVEFTESIQIGGIKGSSETLGILADETLDSKLEDQHEWFAENAGLRVVE